VVKWHLSYGLLLAIAFVIAIADVSASDTGIFVSPEGRDDAPGSVDAPVATLERARDLARQATGDPVIRVRGGTYRMAETLVLDRRDSGLTVAAVGSEQVVISGAAPLNKGWARAEGSEGVWEIVVPEEFGEVRTLFRKGVALPRASTRGFRQLAGPPKSVPYRQRRAIDGQYLYLPDEALQEVDDFRGGEMRVVPRFPWLMEFLPMSEVDRATGLVRSEVPSIYPLTVPAFGWFPKGTLWIENVMSALDEDGEWVFDADSRMLYLLSQKKPESVEAARLTELLRIEGEIDRWDYVDKPVVGVRLRGLTFAHAKRYAWQADKTGWGLQHDWEMYDRPTAMVRLRATEEVEVVDCDFVDSGAAGLRMDLHAQRNSVRYCEFARLGGVGVLLAGYGMGWKDVSRENVVADCRFSKLGCEWWASPAVFVWQSGSNRILHNDIFDLPYSGIVVSGRTQLNVSGLKESSKTARWDEVMNHLENGDRMWLAREPLMHSRNNEIGSNDISDVMKVLSDGNAIYVSGAGGGNRIHHNYIHDIDSVNINASIRIDDDQNDVVIEDNVVVRCTGEGIVLKGRNVVRHNLVSDLRAQTSDGVEALFQRGYLVLSGAPIDGSVVADNAFLSRTPGQDLIFERPEVWQKGGKDQPPVTLDAAMTYGNVWSTPINRNGQSSEEDDRDKRVWDFPAKGDSLGIPVGGWDMRDVGVRER